jgi:hypothetical protein
MSGWLLHRSFRRCLATGLEQIDRMPLSWHAHGGAAISLRFSFRQDEALRDLARAHHAAEKDGKRVGNRLKKLLLKEGLHPPEEANPGTVRYKEWLHALRSESLARSETMAEHLRTTDEA